MLELKKIGVLSAGLYSALITAFLSFIAGFFIAVFSSAIVAAIDLTLSTLMIWLYGLIAIPLIGLITGFISGCVFALLYNLLAHMFGGLKVDLVLAGLQTQQSA